MRRHRCLWASEQVLTTIIPRLDRHRPAPMATTTTIRITARRMAITGRITLLAACLSGSAPGIADTTDAATMAAPDMATTDVATMAVPDMATTDVATMAVPDMAPGQDMVGATQVGVVGASMAVAD